MESRYKVSDIMTRKPATITTDLTVKDAAKQMREKKVGSLLVVKDKNLVGLITEKDIVVKVASTDAKASDFNVDDVMTPIKELITTTSNQGIDVAIMLMKDNDVRRLPVIDNDELTGIITSKDILKIEPDLFEHVYETYDVKEQERKLKILDR